jgi:tetratricopeptide (TPR) repeat protein
MHPRRTYLGTGLLLLIVAALFPGCTRESREARFLAQADRYFNAGQYAQARIEYLNTLRLDPKNASAFLRIGTILSEQGDNLQALRYLSKARSLMPDNVEVHDKIGALYLSLDDANAARQEALAALKLVPGDGQAILLLVNSVRSRPNVDQAQQQLASFPNRGDLSYQLASAGILFREGKQAQGEQAIHAALKLNPSAPSAHLAMADIDLAQNDRSQAEQEFHAAADLSPPHGLARLRYAEFELGAGEAEKAKGILTDILTKSPDFLAAWLLQARVALAGNKADVALGLVARALQLDPLDLDAHILEAQIWTAEGNPQSAIADLQRLPDPYTNVPIVEYQLAQAYLREGDINRAMAALDRALDTSPHYSDALLLLASINLRGGNPQAVVDPMLDLLARQPDADRPRILLAEAYAALKRFDEATGIFQKQIQKNPNDPESYFMLGMTLMDEGSLSEARAAFGKAQQLAPHDLLPTFQLVAMDIAGNDFDAAIKRVQDQIQAQSQSASAQFLLGKIYVAKKDWPDAEAALSKALALDSDLTSASELLPSVYVAEHKNDQAINAIDTFLQRSPNNPSALLLLGDLYESTKQLSKAEETYEHLLALQPNSASALNNLAYLYSGNPNYLEKAMELATKARALLPDDPSVADTLGWICYQRGDYRQALALLQESASRTPVPSGILYHLGMTEYMMDDPDSARVALQQAADAPEDFDGKANIAPRLEILNRGAYAKASIDQLQAIVKLQPDDLYGQIALGDALRGTGQWANAATCYERALALNPSLLSVTLNLAGLYNGSLNDPDKAFELAKKARDLSPSDPRPGGMLGRIAYRKGQFLEAYNLLDQLLNSAAADASDPPTLLDFAWAAYSQGKAAEARSAMQRVVNSSLANSSQADAARTFLTLTDPAATPWTEAQLSAFLQTNPDYVPALIMLAQEHIQSGDTKGATEALTEILARFPDFPAAQIGLASLYLQQPGDQARAYDLALRAHNSQPDNPQISRVLAEISYQRKDYSYAVRLLDGNASLKPLDSESLFYLGMSLWRTNADADWRGTLQQAVTGGLREPQLSEANSVLAGLEKD